MDGVQQQTALPNVGSRRSGRERAAVNYDVDGQSDDDLMEDEGEENEEDEVCLCRVFRLFLACFSPCPVCFGVVARKETFVKKL